MTKATCKGSISSQVAFNVAFNYYFIRIIFFGICAI